MPEPSRTRAGYDHTSSPGKVDQCGSVAAHEMTLMRARIRLSYDELASERGGDAAGDAVGVRCSSLDVHGANREIGSREGRRWALSRPRALAAAMRAQDLVLASLEVFRRKPDPDRQGVDCFARHCAPPLTVCRSTADEIAPAGAGEAASPSQGALTHSGARAARPPPPTARRRGAGRAPGGLTRELPGACRQASRHPTRRLPDARRAHRGC